MYTKFLRKMIEKSVKSAGHCTADGNGGSTGHCS